MSKLLRNDFPLINNSNLAYLDNAATSQKPQCVIDEISRYYIEDNANPMRGLYDLSIRATAVYENAREKVAKFINCKTSDEIVFTRNATEGFNLVAYSYGMNFLNENDEILVGITEHHSNLLPWQQVAKKTGAKLKFLECDKSGVITTKDLEESLTPKTKLVAITQLSNVTGVENNIVEFSKIIHANNSLLVLDSTQAVPHIKVDVSKLNPDFMAFSSHKMYGPMGIGILYGKKELLDKMPPFLYGGEMIESVTIESAVFAPVPQKFEAGTVTASAAAGLKVAIEYIEKIGFEKISERENLLTSLALEGLKDYPYIHIIGSENPKEHHGIISFTIDGVHPHDISEILAADDIAIRAGHHCAQPLLNHLGISSSARASFAFYNSEDEIQRFISSVKNLRKRMGYGN